VFYEIFHCHLVLAAEINDVQPVRAAFRPRKRMMTACSDVALFGFCQTADGFLHDFTQHWMVYMSGIIKGHF